MAESAALASGTVAGARALGGTHVGQLANGVEQGHCNDVWGVVKSMLQLRENGEKQEERCVNRLRKVHWLVCEVEF